VTCDRRAPPSGRRRLRSGPGVLAGRGASAKPRAGHPSCWSSCVSMRRWRPPPRRG
jgi:hypothetical protein